MHKNIILVVLLLSCLQLFSLSASDTADIIVAKDGSGHYQTIQEAIYSIPPLRKIRTVIYIKNGVYKEKLVISKAYGAISFIGQSADSTIITNDDYASKKNIFGEEIGTSGSSSVYIFADSFYAENITFQNAAGNVGQAVAVRVNGDKVIFKNCKFLGNQDTLYPNQEGARQYYYKCYIEGTIDFIFGWATAVFDSCHIHSLRENTSWITAASTNKEDAYGLVFRNCKLTGNCNNCTYLGRPWRNYAKTVFISCFMDKSIKTEGWHNWNKEDAEKTAFYAEYKTFGPGANPDKRVSWSHQLSDSEAKDFSLENIFGDWIPEFE